MKCKGDTTDAARPTILLYMLCSCRRYSICIRYIFRIGYFIRGNCTSDKYFLYKWSTRLQSMYNHMVGRAAAVVSPFYFILLDIIINNDPKLIKLKTKNNLEFNEKD